jgi:glycosyltransferase involved in cell wall biosynthesis
MSVQAFIETLKEPRERNVAFTISVILPTRNENSNIAPLLKRIERAVNGYAIEVIFVDDSDDDTPQAIRCAARESTLAVRLIHRKNGERTGGLGTAVVEGFRAAKGEWLCVMDADLQHPPEIIVKMLRSAQANHVDLIIGSRYAKGASTPGLDQLRTAISHSLILSARVLFPRQLHDLTDPLTGLFLVRRDTLDLDRLYPNGFKILLEMIIQFPELKKHEMGFEMASRHSGVSKANLFEVLRYFSKLIELRLTRGNPNFVRFLIVGSLGFLVNSLALLFFSEGLHLHYLFAAALATQVSTGWNFFLTEKWVFQNRRKLATILQRAMGFYALNNSLLIIRSPALYFFVENLNLNYVVANLISLVFITLTRYIFSKEVIWLDQSRKAKDISGHLDVPT